MKAVLDNQTIAAQATAVGRGGVGIIRISGSDVKKVANAIIGKLPKPRVCEYHHFYTHDQILIDAGLVVFFPAPHSFTGEDVIEFHGHGGPVVMDSLLKQILLHDVRMANPGEFTQRAFLNGKCDLTQAEAIADLIDSASEQAARSAIRSLQGDFSKKINTIVDQLKSLRVFVEANIDFSDEDVPLLESQQISQQLAAIGDQLDHVCAQAKQGQLLREGMRIVIVGKPNVGKSSLLNALSGRETAIVTDIPGTTRDLLNEHILIDGIPLHIVDTAGLRETQDKVEQEGVRRARDAMKNADQVLLIVDAQEDDEIDPVLAWNQQGEQVLAKGLTIVHNKIDKKNQIEKIENNKNICHVYLSAKYGQGIDLLRQHLKKCAGANISEEGGFIARRRHITALNQAKNFLTQAKQALTPHIAFELMADDLRQAQNKLGEITGEISSDDLLGEIFSHFCIGK
jgi:tRNA modification GTPase